MDNVTKSSLVKILQKEFVRRNLIKFFEDKGFGNFLVKPYPPTLIDISDRVPVLDGMLEVKYFLEDINMKNNMVKLGWNMFVNGSNRIFLGYTNHASLTEVDNGINSSNHNHDGPIDIKGIVESVVEFLGKSNKLRDIYNNAKAGDGDVTKLGNFPRPFKPIPDLRRRT